MSETAKQGSVASIYIAPVESAPMEARQAVRAIPGGGLEGDRYYEGTGYYSGDPVWDADVTLIELEAIEGVNQRFGLALDPGAPRRNIVTRGVPLQELIGKKFRVGDAFLELLEIPPSASEGEEDGGAQEPKDQRFRRTVFRSVPGATIIPRARFWWDCVSSPERDFLLRYHYFRSTYPHGAAVRRMFRALQARPMTSTVQPLALDRITATGDASCLKTH